MKEIELTPKAEEDLEAIWNYSFRQLGLFRLMSISAGLLLYLTCWPPMISEPGARNWETISFHNQWQNT